MSGERQRAYAISGRWGAHVWQLVVHDQIDVRDVEAAGRHIGGHQHTSLAFAEAQQGALAGHLRDVAVQRLWGAAMTHMLELILSGANHTSTPVLQHKYLHC